MSSWHKKDSSTAVLEQPQQNQNKQEPFSFAQTAKSQPNSQANTWDKIRNFKVEFGPSSKDILNFTTQLAVMVRAGISLQDALEAIASQQENKKFAAVVFDLRTQIEAGQSFSQSLAGHPEVFSNLYINMVGAAEISGSLSSMLQKLAEYLDQEAETRSQVKGAMVYPGIIATMAVVVTVFLLCFVLPRFTGIFAGKEHMLPGPTKFLLASSLFVRTYWYLIVPGIAGLLWAFSYYIGTKPGRAWWDKAVLRIPLVKTMCRSLYITRGLNTMSVLVKAGVPILNVISITAQISGNVHYKNMWLAVYEEVRQGKKIASSLAHLNAQSKLMPPNVVQMIRSGEESGSMSDVLKDVADFYARELRTVIKAVTSMIEPIMIVVMGVLVGFIAMSIILPIFKMSSVVSGK
jgi:type IV pilus assembly protein PilC